MEKEKLTSSTLAARLWQMANALRGNIDASEFKDYTLGLLFYKFLSDKSISLAKEMFGEFDSYAEIFEKEEIAAELLTEKLGCAVRPGDTFDSMIKKINTRSFTTEDLKDAFDHINDSMSGYKEAQKAFLGLFTEAIDLHSSKLGKDESDRSAIIAKILTEINKIYSDYESSEFDILGTAYEILIGNFAASAGKKGGEFYTPASIQDLVCQLASIGFENVESVADPTCGSASMLIRLSKYVKASHFYGTELNSTTERLARMNMILHNFDFDQFDIRQGNTLKTPDLAEGETYQIVVANPPYSAHWDNGMALEDPRFIPYEKAAPKTKADFAFVEHIVYHLSDDGRAAILLPHGVLFRGAAEATIRKKLLEKGFVDAIIGLPANCFYGTGIPVCCIVIDKNRKKEDPICIIDASKYYKREKTMNVLTDEDIKRIINAYKNKTDVDKFCHMASFEEIKQNDFNLNIARYVDSSEDEEPIDIDELLKQIRETEEEIKKTNDMLKPQFDELGLAFPF